MRSSTRRHDALVMLSGIASAFLVVSGIQVLSGRIDGVASMVFVLAVFLISMYTDGYLWGLAASLLCVLAVNFAFRSPYFAFNFTLPENLFSALVMLVVGGMQAYTVVWDLGDVGIGLMTIFNMLALYPLAGDALTALREYEAKKKLK